MAGNVAKSHFISFEFSKDVSYSTDFFSAPPLGRRFAQLRFRLLCVRLAVHSFVQTKTATSRMAVYACACNSLFVSLPFFTKQQREKATFYILGRT